MENSPRARATGSLLVGLGLVTMLAAAAVWCLAPPPYEAFSLVRVAHRPPAMLHGDAGDDYPVFKRTQVQLMLSSGVLESALADPAVRELPLVAEHPDPVRWLHDALHIDYPDDAEIMRVALAGNQPREQAALVNGVVEAYMKEIVQRDRQVQQENEVKLRRAFERQAAEYQRELEALRTLEQIHKTDGSEAAQLKKKLAVEELEALIGTRNDLRKRVDEAQLEIIVHQAAAEVSAEGRTAQGETGAAPAESGESQESSEAQPSNGAQPGARVEGQSAPAAPAAQPLPRDPALALLERKHEFLQQKLADVEQRIGRMIEEVSQLESFSAQVAAKQEQIEQMREIKTRLAAELDRILVERLAPQRIARLDEATISGPREGVPGGRLLAAAAGLGGVLAAAGWFVRRRPAP